MIWKADIFSKFDFHLLVSLDLSNRRAPLHHLLLRQTPELHQTTQYDPLLLVTMLHKVLHTPVHCFAQQDALPNLFSPNNAKYSTTPPLSGVNMYNIAIVQCFASYFLCVHEKIHLQLASDECAICIIGLHFAYNALCIII